MEKTKLRFVLDHLSVALLLLSKGDRPLGFVSALAFLLTHTWPIFSDYIPLGQGSATLLTRPFLNFFVGGSGHKTTQLVGRGQC